MRVKKKRKIPLPAYMLCAAFAGAVGMFTSANDHDVAAQGGKRAATIDITKVKIPVNVAQLLTPSERTGLEYRHGIAASYILGTSLPKPAKNYSSDIGDIGDISFSDQTSPLLSTNITVSSYVNARSARDGIQRPSRAEINNFPSEEETRVITMNWAKLYNTTISITASGNDGLKVSKPAAADVNYFAFSPAHFFVGSVNALGNIAAYSTPRSDFVTLNGMSDLGLFQQPYYPDANELYNYVSNNYIPPSQKNYFVDWLDEFAKQINSHDMGQVRKRMQNCADQNILQKCLTPVFQKLAEIDARITTPSTHIYGTSFSAPYGGNIFAKAYLRSRVQCATALNRLDLAFLAAVSTERTLSWKGKEIEFQETGGLIPFNIGAAGYGWLRQSRLDHMIDQACKMVSDDPSLINTEEYHTGRIPITQSQKTLFGFKSDQEMTLARRIIRFEYTGPDPSFAHVRIGEDDKTFMKLPVISGKKFGQPQGIGYIIMSGVMGAQATDPSLVIIKDFFDGGKRDNFRLRAATFYDFGVQSNTLWKKIVGALDNGSISQAPECSAEIINRARTLTDLLKYQSDLQARALACQ
ncbi:MAG TPA: hypothetical protein PLF01_02280 [Alphaproteobacteria bacterium]|nr:hypothetical protein [Alphaproteobacteria bacterium]